MGRRDPSPCRPGRRSHRRSLRLPSQAPAEGERAEPSGGQLKGRAQGIAQFMPATVAERGLLDPFDPAPGHPEDRRTHAGPARSLWQLGSGGRRLQCRPRADRHLAPRPDRPAQADSRLRGADHRRRCGDPCCWPQARRHDRAVPVRFPHAGLRIAPHRCDARAPPDADPPRHAERHAGARGPEAGSEIGPGHQPTTVHRSASSGGGRDCIVEAPARRVDGSLRRPAHRRYALPRVHPISTRPGRPVRAG